METTTVVVTLAIKVAVDDEHPPSVHAEDIVDSTKRLFSTAEVSVIDVGLVGSDAKRYTTLTE